MGWKDRIQEVPVESKSWRDRVTQVEDIEPSTLESIGQSAEAILPMAAQGTTMGFGEEIGSSVAAAGDWLRRKMGIETDEEKLNRQLKEQGFKGDLPTIEDKDIVSQYQSFRDPSREYLKQLHEQAPVTSTVSELAGGLVVPGGAVGVAGKGANLGTKLLKGAGTGGLAGAVYGAGSSEADLTKGEVDKLAGDVATSAGMGAALGGAFPLVGAGLGKAGEKVGKIWEDAKNRNIALQDIADIYKMMKTEGKQFLGQKQLKEQNVKLLPEVVDEIGKTVREVSSVKGQDISNIYKSIQGKIDTVEDLQNAITKIRKEAVDAVNEKEKKELTSFADFLEEKLPKETKVTKTGVELGVEDAEKQRQKLLRDFQAKKKILEDQNLSEIERQKSIKKVTQKAEQKAADKTRQSEILGESPLASSEESISGVVPNYGQAQLEGQRAIVPEFTTGKTLSVPVKEVKTPQLELTPTEVEQDLNRVVFRNKKTGEVAYEKELPKDVLETTVNKAPLESEFVNKLRQDVGKKAYETTNLEQAVKKQASDVYDMLRSKLQSEVKNVDPAQLNKLEELNRDFSNLSNAIKVFEPELKNASPAVREEVNLALSNLVSNINDPRNLSATRMWGNFIDKLKEIAPKKGQELEAKIMNTAKKIDLNMKYLGIDPSMSTDPRRVLAGPAMKWGFRAAEIAGKQAYNLKIAPNKVQKYAKLSSDELLKQSQDQLAKGNTSRANFLKNLSEVTNERKKQALLFTASQNANLNGLFDEEEPEE